MKCIGIAEKNAPRNQFNFGDVLNSRGTLNCDLPKDQSPSALIRKHLITLYVTFSIASMVVGNLFLSSPTSVKRWVICWNTRRNTEGDFMCMTQYKCSPSPFIDLGFFLVFLLATRLNFDHIQKMKSIISLVQTHPESIYFKIHSSLLVSVCERAGRDESVCSGCWLLSSLMIVGEFPLIFRAS